MKHVWYFHYYDSREILKLTQQPDMISFGGGLPSADSFPMEDLKAIINDLTENMTASMLQYGETEGYRLCVKKL